MIEIPATHGFVALVDDEFAYLAEYKWHASSDSPRPVRRMRKEEGGKMAFLSHHILKAPKGMVIDHINGDPWDNRRENLRICTPAENMRNKRKRKAGAISPYKGVCLFKRRYVARIMSDGKQFKLGWYDTAEDASFAYDCAALFLHGDFACLNGAIPGAVARDPADIRASAVLRNSTSPSPWFAPTQAAA